MSDTYGKKTVFTTPQALAPGLTGRPPLPPGKPMVLNRASPEEKKILKRFGWKEGDPVPSDLADMLAADIDSATAEATDLDSMLPPVDMKTPIAKLPKEIDIDDLSPAEREKRYAIIEALAAAKSEKMAEDELRASMVEGVGGVDAMSVNRAIRAATGLGEQIEIDEEPEQSKVPIEAPAQAGNCSHCGFPVGAIDDVEVTDVDKINFTQTLLGLIPFSKEYTGLGHRMFIHIRSLTVEEADMCFRQVFTDRQKGRTVNAAEDAENLVRYKLVLQLVSIMGPGLNKIMPTTWKDWGVTPTEGDTALIPIWDKFQKEIDTNETIHRLLVGNLIKFNRLVQKLEDNIDNPDFWPAID